MTCTDVQTNLAWSLIVHSSDITRGDSKEREVNERLSKQQQDLIGKGFEMSKRRHVCKTHVKFCKKIND